MKKLFLLFSFCFVLSSLAYISEDTSNANYLADQGIVTKQTVAAKYRLDDKILRQEVIGMALKVKGITLPENYKCKKYFADATKNDWVCRAVELAADGGIITRGNKYANPGKYVTRAEALAMIISQYNLDPFPEVSPEGNAWQAEVARKYIGIGIQNRSSSDGFIIKEVKDGMGFTAQWSPNRLATRAEVFAFARNIISSQDSVSGIERYGITDYKSNYKDFSGMVFDYAFGPEVPAYGDETKMTRACTVDFVESPEIGGGFGMLDFISAASNGEGEYNTPISIQLSEKNNIPTLRYETEFAGPYSTKNVFMNNGDTLQIGSWGVDCVDLLNLKNYQTPNAFSILNVYYNNLASWNKDAAFAMRSPAGVSSSTFQSWYKDVEKVVFKNESFKDLGNNTYEFVVDITEAGLVSTTSTYKVKSKVNLEKFTIDNISSVKQ